MCLFANDAILSTRKGCLSIHFCCLFHSLHEKAKAEASRNCFGSFISTVFWRCVLLDCLGSSSEVQPQCLCNTFCHIFLYNKYFCLALKVQAMWKKHAIGSVRPYFRGFQTSCLLAQPSLKKKICDLASLLLTTVPAVICVRLFHSKSSLNTSIK